MKMTMCVMYEETINLLNNYNTITTRTQNDDDVDNYVTC
jgi:hypothetical protein